MRRDGDVVIERRGPETVVRRRRKLFAVGKHIELHALQPRFGAVFQLFHRVVDAGGRNNPHGKQPLRRRLGIFLGEIFIVGVIERDIAFVFLDAANDRDARKQNLGIDAVLILLAHALLRLSRAGAVVEGRHLQMQLVMRHPDAAR